MRKTQYTCVKQKKNKIKQIHEANRRYKKKDNYTSFRSLPALIFLTITRLFSLCYTVFGYILHHDLYCVLLNLRNKKIARM